MINLNGLSVAQKFIYNRAKREIPKIFQGLKPEWIEQLVAEKRSLASILPKEKMDYYAGLAHQFHWVAAIITDEEFLGLIPQWVHDIIERHGQEGLAWRNEQMVWLRSLFR